MPREPHSAYTASTRAVWPIVETFRREQWDLESVLLPSGLSQRDLEDPDRRIPQDVVTDLWAAQVAVHRSNYVASIAMFSGGIEDLSGLQDPTNAFPVAMFDGGTSDVVGAHFQNEAQSGMNMWRSHGHFAVSCDHEGGHSVPPPAGLAGMQFMLDHPYGTLRSPYCDAAPPELSFCALTTPAPDGVPFDESRPPADVQACVDQTKSLGLASQLLTDKLFGCACDHCSSALEACIGDSGCLSTLECAAQNGCMGIGCYQDTLCSSVIDAAGGIMGAGSQLAVAFSDCLGASACALCEGK